MFFTQNRHHSQSIRLSYRVRTVFFFWHPQFATNSALNSNVCVQNNHTCYQINSGRFARFRLRNVCLFVCDDDDDDGDSVGNIQQRPAHCGIYLYVRLNLSKRILFGDNHSKIVSGSVFHLVQLDSSTACSLCYHMVGKYAS